MRKPVTRFPLFLHGELNAETGWYHCGWCGHSISDDPWVTIFHELRHTLSDEELQEIVADHKLDVEDQERAAHEANNSAAASPEPAPPTKFAPKSVVGSAVPLVSELAAKRSFMQVLHERHLAFPTVAIKRLTHAINSGDKRTVERAEKGLSLTHQEHEKIKHLIERGQTTPSEIAEALIGGKTVQVWFGTKTTAIGDNIHTSRTKIGLIRLGRRMHEIGNEPGISPEVKERLRADAYQDFFERYAEDLQEIAYTPPPEYEHCIPLAIAKEWDALIRAVKTHQMSRWQSKNKPVSDTTFKSVVLIALLLLVLLALFHHPNPVPQFLPASPGYVLDTHTGVVYHISADDILRRLPPLPRASVGHPNSTSLR
jgi:hypothetical protein